MGGKHTKQHTSKIKKETHPIYNNKTLETPVFSGISVCSQPQKQDFLEI